MALAWAAGGFYIGRSFAVRIPHALQPAHSLNDIRSAFLDYFAKAGHLVVPSAPLVPQNDPTLLFVNAGMVPFKNIFTGAEQRPAGTARHLVAEVRAGRRQAQRPGQCRLHRPPPDLLRNAGQLLVRRLFQGTAPSIWPGRLITRDLALPARTVCWSPSTPRTKRRHGPVAQDRRAVGRPHHPHRRPADNFWSMGDTGSLRTRAPKSSSTTAPGDRRWTAGLTRGGRRSVRRNLEFGVHAVRPVQAGERPREAVCPSPPSTPAWGWSGSARRSAGRAQTCSRPTCSSTLIAASRVEADRRQGGRGRSAQPSHRVIADHLRSSSSFLIADGVSPSNEGRGYVLRRIMRRAMRHAHLLGAADPLMWRLVPALVEQMGAAYPELVRAEALITETLRQEEERFRITLSRGMGLLEEATVGLRPAASCPVRQRSSSTTPTASP